MSDKIYHCEQCNEDFTMEINDSDTAAICPKCGNPVLEKTEEITNVADPAAEQNTDTEDSSISLEFLLKENIELSSMNYIEIKSYIRSNNIKVNDEIIEFLNKKAILPDNVKNSDKYYSSLFSFISFLTDSIDSDADKETLDNIRATIESTLSNANSSLEENTLLKEKAEEIKNNLSTPKRERNRVKAVKPAQPERNTKKRIAVKSSRKEYWAAHQNEEYQLERYISKNRTYKTLFLLASLAIFTGLFIGCSIFIRALVKSGVGKFTYALSIIGSMLILFAFLIVVYFMYHKFRFTGHTLYARRLLANPVGSEEEIAKFISNMNKTNEEQNNNPIVKKSLIAVSSCLAVVIILYFAMNFLIFPAINYSRAKQALADDKKFLALDLLGRVNTSDANALTEELLADYIEQAKAYDEIVSTYNNTYAVRSTDKDVFYNTFTSTSSADIGMSGVESFILTQNFIFGIRADGHVGYSQYTHSANVTTPEVTSWNEILKLGLISGSVIGYQDNHKIIFNSAVADTDEVSRLTDISIIGVYDKLGVFGVREDGTVSVPDSSNYSYKEQVERALNEISLWKNITLVKGDLTNHIVGLTKNGRCYATKGWYDSDYGQLNVSEWRNIVDIAVGESHTVGLKADGTCVATGSNSYGQCEVSEWKDIVAIEAGNNFTIGISKDGTLYITGFEDKCYSPRGFEGICILNSSSSETDDEYDEEYYSEISSSVVESSVISSSELDETTDEND